MVPRLGRQGIGFPLVGPVPEALNLVGDCHLFPVPSGRDWLLQNDPVKAGVTAAVAAAHIVPGVGPQSVQDCRLQAVSVEAVIVDLLVRRGGNGEHKSEKAPLPGVEGLPVRFRRELRNGGRALRDNRPQPLQYILPFTVRQVDTVQNAGKLRTVALSKTK